LAFTPKTSKSPWRDRHRHAALAGVRRRPHRLLRDAGHGRRRLVPEARQFCWAGRGADSDKSFATICATLATAAAELDIQAIEDAGELAVLVFSQIATGQARELYAADTLASFSQALRREVTANDMTPAIDKLVAANLIVRKGHGHSDIADPFVKQVWLRHMQMRQSLSGE
jgi:hypothetical protein